MFALWHRERFKWDEKWKVFSHFNGISNRFGCFFYCWCRSVQLIGDIIKACQVSSVRCLTRNNEFLLKNQNWGGGVNFIISLLLLPPRLHFLLLSSSWKSHFDTSGDSDDSGNDSASCAQFSLKVFHFDISISSQCVCARC